MKIQQRMEEADRGVRAENFCVHSCKNRRSNKCLWYLILQWMKITHIRTKPSVAHNWGSLIVVNKFLPSPALPEYCDQLNLPPHRVQYTSPRWNHQPPQVFAHPRTPTVGKKNCSTRTKPTCSTNMGDDYIHHIGVNLARPTKILSLPKRMVLERVAKAIHAMKCQTI